MEIIIADNAGFCFGVKRAVDMTNNELLNPSKDIYSLGPLIHNQQAVEKLKEEGLQTIDDTNDIEGINNSKIIIRAHGVSKSVIDTINEKDLEIIDSTCPYVKSVHKRVEEYENQGYNIIIIGDPNHPEIIGINGWCNNNAFIVNSLEEATNLPIMDKICVVSQTTNTQEKFETLSEIIKGKGKEVKIFNTICNATNLRQESCRQLSSQVDAMIVIGGYHSSNTRKLAEVSKKYCKNVYHIETSKELPLQTLSKFNKIGITAGASTPDWIIKEVVETMDNINNNEMMEAIENSFTKIRRGDVLKGEVIYVTNNEVMVNINYRSDGIVNREELSNDPEVKPKDLYKVGDEINVFVVKIDDGEGNVVLSAKRANDFKNWDEIEVMFNNKDRVECKVLNSIKGGLAILVNGINGFMPASQVSTSFVSDLSVYKGKTLIAKIIDFDKEKRRVILSRKEVEREELSNKRKELWANISVDQVVEGVVQRLTDFGAFVDLGGVDGLIHISDLSWNRVKHPSNVVKEGEKVLVKILALDKDKNRISLGLKQTVEEPWSLFSKNVNVGDIVEGTVVNLLDFGAFVRLNEGVDGLLHVSQISKEHINKPSDALKVGQKINVKVIDIDEEGKKVGLSLKEALEPSETEETISHKIDEEPEITIGDIVDQD
ncbi:bifunctional 4-hydroxy-3-methylbut-2-enyl diphosphate reductase/30S ribosomal protein S1 [Tissierella sp. MB52-C2]|uniref:bifunctional 4-hydroxy-3-methylbut-2-enyl diphosphate reductase/30S ribosomal protein S1 n=1 Tax=Tissierella sp. MB52-C2 TaxID=3070999 RepID=UPI00280B2504|nr:bifunctional 4-hydroxy-3-methylbut-2-enyl diphosphate reductase/30S ribosomal protein S1 [Tissierella sp. MB52-C2]WMM26505.1 bifunctional 4-hydroxy-3-methylbut-2-enyl diphosphate reductase/30S ribosomal protein S1 [Tissierella sp. MB52-C2]